MSPQTVTLIAAGVAALASLASMVVNIYFARRASRESQFRDLLKPHLTQLGEDLHSVVACCRVVGARADRNQRPNAWLAKANAACARLNCVRLKVRYPLWGIGEGIRELTRLAGLVSHTQEDSPRRDEILAAADSLRLTLDDTIKASFLRGTPPSPKAQERVRTATERLRNFWDQRPEEALEDLVETEQHTAEEPPASVDSLVEPELSQAHQSEPERVGPAGS